MNTTTERRGLLARFLYEGLPAAVSAAVARQQERAARGRRQREAAKAWQASEARWRARIEALKGPEGRWVDQLTNQRGS